MSLSSKAKEAALAPETGEIFLTLIEISHPDMEQPLYFVDNTENIVSGGKIHVGCAFKYTPPTFSADESRPARIAIDNVDRQIMEVIRPINTPFTMKISTVLASQPDVIEEGPHSFILRNITSNVYQVSGDLYDLYLTDRQIPADTYNPFDCPGLF